MDRILDMEKLKQRPLDEGAHLIRMRGNCGESAKFYVAEYCYTTRISFHAFSLVEFDLMYKASNKFGHGLKVPGNMKCMPYSLKVCIVMLIKIGKKTS